LKSIAHLLSRAKRAAGSGPFIFFPEKHGAGFQLATAVTLTLAALWVRLELAPLDAGLQYLTFFPAVALATVIAGIRGGAIAVLIGLCFASFILTPPFWSVAFENLRNSFWSNLVFVADGVIICFSIESMHRYRQKYTDELRQSFGRLDAFLSSENKFHILFDSANDCIMLLSPDGRIVDINRIGHERLGYTKEEMLGRRITEFDPREFAGRVPERMAQIMRDGVITFESAHLHKNGTRIPVEINCQMIELNSEKRLFSIVRDMTERKQAQAVIQKSEANLRAILDNSPYLTWLKDKKGRYISINRLYSDYLRLADPAQAIGKTDFELHPEALAKKYRADDTEVMATRRQKHLEEEAFDGKVTHWVETYKTPIIDAQSNVLGTVGFSSDITERKQAERALREFSQQLEKKEMAKTRFLAAAGHDLRQPLAAANLYLYALWRTAPTREQGEILRGLEQAMGAFRGLLDTLLDISRLDAGVVKPAYEPVRLCDLLIWLEELFAPMANNKQVAFRLYFPSKEMLIVKSDLPLLKSVLMNLVSNAVKFTPPDGSILVAARRRGDRALIQVWDTGIGIAAGKTGQIFEEFYQINNPQRDRTLGLGLGLSIVERSLALLDTKVECRSVAGSGSVFGFSLPLYAEPQDVIPDTHAALQEGAVSERWAKGRRFVVVEDDAMVAKALYHSLTTLGGEVVSFPNADSALDHASACQDDYYIVDYMLGGSLNGLQFLEHVEQKLGNPIRAVLVTGDTSVESARTFASRRWPVLQKPASLSQLLAGLGAREGG
jgi:PAS domain S-box-containing protein